MLALAVYPGPRRASSLFRPLVVSPRPLKPMHSPDALRIERAEDLASLPAADELQPDRPVRLLYGVLKAEASTLALDADFRPDREVAPVDLVGVMPSPVRARVHAV